MNRSNLYDRHLSLRLILNFLGIFSLIFLLYLSLDYSMNFSRIANRGMNPILLYLNYLSLRLDVLLPMSFLLALIRVLLQLNMRFELIALMSVGVCLKRIVRPALSLALLLSTLLLINYEWLYPHTEKYNTRKLLKDREKVYSITLKDGSRLIFKKEAYDARMIRNAYHVSSIDDIWYCKEIIPTESGLEAHFADHFVRNDEGLLEKRDSLEKHLFPATGDLPRSLKLQKLENQYEFFSIRRLAKLVVEKNSSSPISDRAKIETQLLAKLFIPLLPLLIAFSAIPLVTRFSRSHRPLLIYTVAIFAFILLSSMINAGIILGENYALPPILAVGVIPTLILAIASGRYYLHSA